MDPEFMVEIVNNYIQFYRSEVEDVDIFSGIDEKDMASTNRQLSLLYAEKEIFENSDEESTKITLLSTNTPSKDYIIYKNNIPYCTSSSLFAVLIEITNLKNEDQKSNYKIKCKQ